MSMHRISMLKGEPEFRELVEKYRTRADVIEIDAYKQVMVIRAAIEQLALEELRDRLEASPEKFSVKELQDLQGDVADRLGRSKVSRTESISMNVDLAESLAEARRRELNLAPVDQRKN